MEAYRTAECPVSLINADSVLIVEQFHAAESLHKSGGVLFGTDASKYPAWWTDAISAIHRARNAVEEALEKKRASN